jgi:hypothetical protein
MMLLIKKALQNALRQTKACSESVLTADQICLDIPRPTKLCQGIDNEKLINVMTETQ